MRIKICTCGSGKERYELLDASAVFVCFVCQDCEKEKKAQYDPRIFEQSYDPDQPETYWSEDY